MVNEADSTVHYLIKSLVRMMAVILLHDMIALQTLVDSTAEIADLSPLRRT